MAARRTTRPKVKQYLEERAGQTCYVVDMQKDLGLEKKQIQSAVYAMITHDLDPIDVVIAGNAWRWELVTRGERHVAARPGSRTAPNTAYPVRHNIDKDIDEPKTESKPNDECTTQEEIQEESGVKTDTSVELDVTSERTVEFMHKFDAAHQQLMDLMRRSTLPHVNDPDSEANTPPTPSTARFVSFRVIAERGEGEFIGQAATDDDDGFYHIKPI